MSSRFYYFLSFVFLSLSFISFTVYYRGVADTGFDVSGFGGSVVCNNTSLDDFVLTNFTGYSMSPSIVPAYRALYLPVNDTLGVVVGDVLVYRDRDDFGVFVAHRVIEITADGCFVLRGDNNVYSDSIVCGDVVLGVVCGVLY